MTEDFRLSWRKIATLRDAFEQFIAQYGAHLAGKVIVDPSNPVGPDGQGGYHKVIGEQESSGQILAGLLPAGARLVKAFGTLSAPTLSSAARREPEHAVQFYAADDAAAGDLVADLIRAGGYEPVPRRRPGPVHPHRDVRRPARIRCPGPGRDQIGSAKGDLTWSALIPCPRERPGTTAAASGAVEPIGRRRPG